MSFGRSSTETLLTDLMLGQRKKGARIVDVVNGDILLATASDINIS